MIAAGCGGGSSPGGSTARSTAAQQLLEQTFNGHHTIRSGVLALDLSVTPTGSTTITRPLGLSFGGPFTTAGAGKVPDSDFTIAVFAQGHRGVLQLISAGGSGYITVSGQSYRMPASSFKSLGSGFGSLASAGGSSKSSALAKLGIRPLDWLTDPRIVGSATIGGQRTTLIRARVDATRLLHGLSTILGKASSGAVTGSAATSLPRSISAATQRRIAQAIGSPTLSVWTGASDRILRRLTLTATIPVTGASRTQLGGMRAATVTLEIRYSDLNRPQTIVAPTRLAPYSAFRTKVDSVLAEIEGGLGTSTLNGGGTTTGSSGASAVDQKYTHCITAAGGDISKMQKCARLLGGH